MEGGSREGRMDNGREGMREKRAILYMEEMIYSEG